MEYDDRICEMCQEKATTKVVFGCHQSSKGTSLYRPLYVCGKCLNIVVKSVVDLIKEVKAKS